MIRNGDGLSQVIEVLGNNFKGAADVAGQSAKGQLALMNGAFTDMKESLGMALLPALEAVIPMLVKFSDWAANHVNVVIGIGTAIAGIATAIAVYVGVQKAANAVMIVATTLNWAMAASETAKNTAATLGVGAAAIAAGLVVAMGALTIFKNKTKDLTSAQVEQNAVLKETAIGFGTTSEMIYRSDRAQLKAAYSTAYATEETKKQEKGLGGLSDTTKKATDKLKELKKAAEDAAEALREETAKAVKEAADALNKELGDALDTAKENLKIAQTSFSDFSTAVNEGVTGAFSFKDAQDAGSETGEGFISGLESQVKKIAGYSYKVNELLRMGLSQNALKKVLEAGFESGNLIADYLIAGGVDVIGQTNALTKSVEEMGIGIGFAAANVFYRSGVSNAEQYLKGVEDAFARAQARINGAGSGLTLADVKGIGAGFFDQVTNGYTPTPLEQFMQDGGNLSSNDNGNIVYNINVNGGISTSAEIGRSVIDAVKQYSQVYGPVNFATL